MLVTAGPNRVWKSLIHSLRPMACGFRIKKSRPEPPPNDSEMALSLNPRGDGRVGYVYFWMANNQTTVRIGLSITRAECRKRIARQFHARPFIDDGVGVLLGDSSRHGFNSNTFPNHIGAESRGRPSLRHPTGHCWAPSRIPPVSDSL
jgi:hypothetical protein